VHTIEFVVIVLFQEKVCFLDTQSAPANVTNGFGLKRVLLFLFQNLHDCFFFPVPIQTDVNPSCGLAHIPTTRFDSRIEKNKHVYSAAKDSPSVADYVPPERSSMDDPTTVFFQKYSESRRNGAWRVYYVHQQDYFQQTFAPNKNNLLFHEAMQWIRQHYQGHGEPYEAPRMTTQYHLEPMCIECGHWRENHGFICNHCMWRKSVALPTSNEFLRCSECRLWTMRVNEATLSVECERGCQPERQCMERTNRQLAEMLSWMVLIILLLILIYCMFGASFL
jgi:hypothetical protein